MKVFLFIVLIATTLTAHARKPAVEDFVGVEPESYKVTPPGTEVLFNFDQNVQTYQNQAPEFVESAQSPWLGVIVIAVFITLPVATWFGLRETPAPQSTATPVFKNEPAVAHLDDYRKEKDDGKKAS